MKNLPDWLIRALKTFVQAFFGVLIPSFASYISEGFPEDWNTLWMWLLPVICASLSAAISAVWNFLLEYQQAKQLEKEEEPIIENYGGGGGGSTIDNKSNKDVTLKELD